MVKMRARKSIKKAIKLIPHRRTSTPIQTIRIVMFGSGGVGKTSLVNRFLFNRFKLGYVPTVEDEYRQVLTHNNHIVDVTVLDTAGSYQFPAMRKLAIQQGHGFIIVYSLDNYESLNEAKRIYNEITKLKDSNVYPIVLVGNKTDLFSENQSVISKDKIEETLASWNYEVAHIETSAKLNENVASVFDTLIGFVDEIKTESNNKPKVLSPSMLTNRLSDKTIQTSSLIKLPVTRKEAIFRSYSLETNLDLIKETNKKHKSRKRRMIKKLFFRKT